MSIATERRAQVSVQVGSQEISFETGKLAKQADGAVVVRSGETMVLATAVGRSEARAQNQQSDDHNRQQHHHHRTSSPLPTQLITSGGARQCPPHQSLPVSRDDTADPSNRRFRQSCQPVCGITFADTEKQLVILPAGDDLVFRNQVEGNTGCGLVLNPGTGSIVYRSNMLRGNGAGVCDAGTGNIDGGGNIL